MKEHPAWARYLARPPSKVWTRLPQANSRLHLHVAATGGKLCRERQDNPWLPSWLRTTITWDRSFDKCRACLSR